MARAVVWHAHTDFVLYSARQGDTVESIAVRFHVSIGGIYELNGMLAGQEVQMGETYKIPTDPSYGMYYRPASYVVTGYGTTTYTNSPWTSLAGNPPDGALCGATPSGVGDSMGNYDLSSFQLKGPNPGSTWIRGFTWYHFGVDISQPAGAPIHAAQAGEVIFAGWDPGGGGWTVKINHCNHLSTMYCHMVRYLVHVHQMVSAGDLIGLEGMTGNAAGPHLHFQVEWDNRPVDPLLFYGRSIYNITH